MSLKKIAIVGPESTGKSQLAEQLAKHNNTKWVPEYAREYLENLGRPYHQGDLLEIAKGQIKLEDKIAEKTRDLLFCDTNLIVLKIWSDHSYGETDKWILDQLQKRHYDYYLLTDIDLPWEPDLLREHPDMRGYFFKKYEDYLINSNLPFSFVCGQGEERFKNALTCLNSMSLKAINLNP